MQRLIVLLAALSVAALIGCQQPSSPPAAGDPGPQAEGTQKTQLDPEKPLESPPELVRTTIPKTAPTVLGPNAIDPSVPTGPAPMIVCEAPEHDYGTVIPGAEVKHTFTVRNDGKKPLTIKRTEAG